MGQETTWASWRGMLSSSNQMSAMRRKQGRFSKDGLCSWIAQARGCDSCGATAVIETAWVKSPRKNTSVVEP
jgi:hypothetical protein